ncbi:unnamed protein product [Rotaria magnacalcarata]|uniref:Mutator-like transposase domain-containing protein n=1 Tax=Rotaria magnacalcarata TaxID=392030 RepID=A0A816C3E8_9BILA|nr:unnamed protein product [Rotaria magnacalcarata]
MKTRSSSSSSSANDESMVSIQNQSTPKKLNIEDTLNSNVIIHMNSLLSLPKQFQCPGCHMLWDGSVTIKERNGLYVQLEFTCDNCKSSTLLYSSPSMPTGRRHEINVRLAIGSTLCGLGRSGVMKLLGALNLPLPVQENKFQEVQEYVLNFVDNAQEQSMTAAVEEAVLEADSARDLTVSGDGAWLTRGHSSLHGIATLCSSTTNPKILDATWCSKKCCKCQGAESLRHVNADLYSTFQSNHECQLNFSGASGTMEKEMVYEVFCQSLLKYNVRYVSYIGDGDAKVHSYLTSHPPYPATRESKTDLDHLYKRSWAIFKHHYSTDNEPMHDWCDVQWCKYLQAKLNGRTYYHNSKSNIPRSCLDMIKPVFHELCSKTSLARVIGGGSQNVNEAFHSLLRTMAPKHRFCSSTILRTALGLSTIIYNDGYDSLEKLFEDVFSSVGYFSAECFSRLGTIKKSSALKLAKRCSRTKTTNVATTTSAADISGSESDDGMLLIPNNKDSLDITQDIMTLELSDNDTNSDYEPGGEE